MGLRWRPILLVTEVWRRGEPLVPLLAGQCILKYLILVLVNISWYIESGIPLNVCSSLNKKWLQCCRTKEKERGSPSCPSYQLLKGWGWEEEEWGWEGMRRRRNCSTHSGRYMTSKSAVQVLYAYHKRTGRNLSNVLYQSICIGQMKDVLFGPIVPFKGPTKTNRGLEWYQSLWLAIVPIDILFLI
jgi:hypothetical protein